MSGFGRKPSEAFVSSAVTTETFNDTVNHLLFFFRVSVSFGRAPTEEHNPHDVSFCLSFFATIFPSVSTKEMACCSSLFPVRALCQKEFIGRGGRADGAGEASKTVRDTRGEVLLTSSQVSDAIVSQTCVRTARSGRPTGASFYARSAIGVVCLLHVL